MTFSGAEYRNESDVRKAIEFAVIQQNRDAARSKVDAAFSAIIDLYKSEHMPGREHSTNELSTYILRKYISPRFGNSPIREVTAAGRNPVVQRIETGAYDEGVDSVSVEPVL